MSNLFKKMFSRNKENETAESPFKKRKKIVIKRKDPVLENTVVEDLEKELEEIPNENSLDLEVLTSIDETIILMDEITEEKESLEVVVSGNKEPEKELNQYEDKYEESDIIVENIEEVSEENENASNTQSLVKDLEDRLRIIQSEKEKLEELNRNLNQSKRGLKEQIKTLRQEKKNMNLEFQIQKESLLENVRTLEKFEQKLQVSEQEKVRLEKLTKNFEEGRREQRSKNDQLSKEKEDLLLQISDLKHINTTQQKDWDKLHTESLLFISARDKLKKEKEGLAIQISNWESNSQSKQKKMDTLLAENAAFKSINNDLKEEKKNLALQISNWEKNNHAKQKELNELSAQNLKFKSINDNLIKEKSLLSASEKELKIKCKELEKNQEEYRLENKELLEKIRILSSRNKVQEKKEEQKEKIINLFIQILPNEEELEVEMSSLITGNELIQELKDAELLRDGRTYDIIIKTTGLRLRKENNLGEAGIKDDEFLVVKVR